MFGQLFLFLNPFSLLSTPLFLCAWPRHYLPTILVLPGPPCGIYLLFPVCRLPPVPPLSRSLRDFGHGPQSRYSREIAAVILPGKIADFSRSRPRSCRHFVVSHEISVAILGSKRMHFSHCSPCFQHSQVSPAFVCPAFSASTSCSPAGEPCFATSLQASIILQVSPALVFPHTMADQLQPAAAAVTFELQAAIGTAIREAITASDPAARPRKSIHKLICLPDTYSDDLAGSAQSSAAVQPRKHAWKQAEAPSKRAPPSPNVAIIVPRDTLRILFHRQMHFAACDFMLL